MELSIVAVTANRKLGKAMTRLAAPLDRLRGCCDGVDTSREAFDILQVVLEDQPEAFVKSHKKRRGSRLQQVSVGLPEGLSFKPEDDATLLAAIERQIQKAVELTAFEAEATKQEVFAKLRNASLQS